MISNNMRLDAFLHHIPQDVPTARCELESEGVEGSVINWEYKPLMRRYEIVWVPVVQ